MQSLVQVRLTQLCHIPLLPIPLVLQAVHNASMHRLCKGEVVEHVQTVCGTLSLHWQYVWKLAKQRQGHRMQIGSKFITIYLHVKLSLIFDAVTQSFINFVNPASNKPLFQKLARSRRNGPMLVPYIKHVLFPHFDGL